MPPAIPDRWIPYKALGKVIEGTRIICFKVPLRKAVQIGNKEIKDIWDIPTLLSEIPNLGGVINLTNTTRYYDPREFRAAGVLYRHVTTPGREIPPEKMVKVFMDTVDEFLGDGCDTLVGVHCTHGLNRTGYMVCRYMRDRLNIPAKDAIKRFEKARGYQIERENYIADLLGEKPPPPDVGKHTKLKPLNDEHNGTRDEDEGEWRQITKKRSRDDSESSHIGSKNPCLTRPEANSKDDSSGSKREGKKKRKKRNKKRNRTRKRGKKSEAISESEK